MFKILFCILTISFYSCSFSFGIDEAGDKVAKAQFADEQLNSAAQRNCTDQNLMYDGSTQNCMMLPLINPCDINILERRYGASQPMKLQPVRNLLQQGYIIHSCGGDAVNFGVSAYQETQSGDSFGLNWRTIGPGFNQ